MLLRRHGRKLSLLLVENLSEDGLLTEILKILDELKLMERLFEAFSKVAPSIVTKYKASRGAVKERFTQLLDAMITDPYYNRKVLMKRTVLLAGSIRRYRERIASITELSERVLADIESDLLKVLKTRAETTSSLADELRKVSSEIKADESVVRLLEKTEAFLKKLEVSKHLNAEELIDCVKKLERFDLELSETISKLRDDIKVLKMVRKLIEQNKSLVKQLEEIYHSIELEGFEALFIRESLQKLSNLLKSIGKDEEIKISEARERATALEVLKRELSRELELADSIRIFLVRLRRSEKKLPKMLRVSMFLDSMTGLRSFESVYLDAARRLNSLKLQRLINSRDDFLELNGKLAEIEEQIDCIISIGDLVKEISRENDELKSLAGLKGWKKEIKKIMSSNAPNKGAGLVLSYLRTIYGNLADLRRKLEEAEKMYHIWARRLIKEISTEKEVDPNAIKSVPEDWREWVIERMKREGIIEMKGGYLHLKEFSPNSGLKNAKKELKYRMKRIKERVANIGLRNELDVRERRMLERILTKLEEVEEKAEMASTKADFLKLKKEMGVLEGLLDALLIEIEGGVFN